jgi:hypothetical protein
MGDLTKNLSRKEFECECGCGFDTVDYELVVMIQDAADSFAVEHNSKITVEITGGNRCQKHNEEVQKQEVKNYVPFSSKSTHIEAKAADHKFFYYKDGIKTQIPPKKVYDYYDKKYPTSKGVGLYSNRTHVDSRAVKARWGLDRS